MGVDGFGQQRGAGLADDLLARGVKALAARPQ